MIMNGNNDKKNYDIFVLMIFVDKAYFFQVFSVFCSEDGLLILISIKIYKKIPAIMKAQNKTNF